MTQYLRAHWGRLALLALFVACFGAWLQMNRYTWNTVGNTVLVRSDRWTGRILTLQWRCSYGSCEWRDID